MTDYQDDGPSFPPVYKMVILYTTGAHFQPRKSTTNSTRSVHAVHDFFSTLFSVVYMYIHVHMHVTRQGSYRILSWGGGGGGTGW